MRINLLVVSLGVVGAALVGGQAHATCGIFCEATLADASCNPGSVFESDERIGAYGECTVQCCAPPSPEFPNGDCSTSIEPLDPNALRVLDESFEPVPGAFLYSGDFCGDLPLLLSDRSLPEGSYYLNGDFETLGSFDVVSDGGGCDTSGGQGSGAGLAAFALLGLGLVGRRRD